MKNLDFGKDKINRLIMFFSIPCVISMLINSVYNIVDQIFIGKGVGTLGNAATNVIFPLIIIFNAVAGLIGNGAAANLSLRLGENNKKEASQSIGNAITLTLIVSILLSVFAYIALPKLVYLFGCTDSVYQYAVDYGRIIIVGAPFMLFYSSISSIIRADGSPAYSMLMLVVGAIINIILDPVFIFVFNMGVKGGALATVIGQVVSFIIALCYIKKIKSVKLSLDDYKLNKGTFKVLALGLSSFITQSIILVLFVFMNNILTYLGSLSKFGADIPLSVYGVISKINSLFISTVLGISIGAQPIIGFNYGAGNLERVKETLKRIIVINFIIGLVFNVLFIAFPEQIAGIFISANDESYSLFMEFAVLMCHSFMLLLCLNSFEMTTSISIQSLGNVKKSTLITFIRQIILFIPISLILAFPSGFGIKGVLYAGAVADVLCFVITIFIFRSEYVKLGKSITTKEESSIDEINNKEYKDAFDKVITISREYGSGGRYVANLLAEKLGIPCYDAELIRLTAKESGFTKEFVEKSDQTRKSYYENDNRIFNAESKVIKKVAEHPCIIVGRCADYILRDRKNVVNIFLYSDDQSKIKRAVKYYNIPKKDALKKIKNINKDRAKHYKFYSNREWKSLDNYDLLVNVDKYGVEECSQFLEKYLRGSK